MDSSSTQQLDLDIQTTPPQARPTTKRPGLPGLPPLQAPVSPVPDDHGDDVELQLQASLDNSLPSDALPAQIHADQPEHMTRTDGGGLSDFSDLANKWKEGFIRAVQALHDRAENISNFKIGGDWPLKLSLIFTSSSGGQSVLDNAKLAQQAGLDVPACRESTLPCVTKYNSGDGVVPFVACAFWKQPGKLEGRLVEIQQERVVALSTFAHKMMSFQHGEIILNTIGVRSHKEPKERRPPLPELAKQLMRMWESSYCCMHSHQHESLSLDGCVLCSDGCLTQDISEDNSVANSSEAVKVCCMCLLPWHVSCSKKAAQQFGMICTTSVVSDLPSAVRQAQVPCRFAPVDGQDPMCSLCRQACHLAGTTDNSASSSAGSAASAA
jgi:hypothetical protein